MAESPRPPRRARPQAVQGGQRSDGTPRRPARSGGPPPVVRRRRPDDEGDARRTRTTGQGSDTSRFGTGSSRRDATGRPQPREGQRRRDERDVDPRPRRSAGSTGRGAATAKPWDKGDGKPRRTGAASAGKPWARSSDDRPRRASAAKPWEKDDGKPRRTGVAGAGKPWARSSDDRPRRASAAKPWEKDDTKPRRTSAGERGKPWEKSADKPRRPGGASTGGPPRKPWDKGDSKPPRGGTPSSNSKPWEKRSASGAGYQGRGTADRRPARPEPVRRPRTEPVTDRPQWGSVARKGGGVVREDRETASSAWRAVVERARENPVSEPDAWEPEVWVEETPQPKDSRAPRREAASSAAPSTSSPRTRKRKIPEPVTTELAAEAGAKRAPRLAERLADAAGAYERERYDDARRILRGLAEEAPRAAAVRELYGLTLYRLGRWLPASKELETYRLLTGAVDQHPALADCYRALGKWKKVADLWDELRAASPGAELVAEGRIVAAAALADRGDVRGGIALLEAGRIEVARPKDHHLRMQYALADLYERAGDMPRARELFRRIQTRDPEFFDVAERIRALA